MEHAFCVGIRVFEWPEDGGLCVEMGRMHYYSDCPCVCGDLILFFFPLLLIYSSSFICGMARKFNKA